MNRTLKGDNALAERLLISICVPVYNEEDNIDPLLRRLSAVARQEKGYDFEFLFTDNASEDCTFERLAKHATKDQRIRVLRFSRNFGFQKSILTNYVNAKGVAAIQLDADLQDPPELIPEFLRTWERGYKVVYGIRKRLPEFFLMRWTRRAYYRLISALSDVEVPLDAGDFRLIDRIVIDELRSVREQTPYLRGIIASLGYAQTGIAYDRSSRLAGGSKFRFFDLLALGLDGITSQSTRPLRFVTIFGFLISIIAALTAVFYLIYLPTSNSVPDGFTTLSIIGLVSLGLNAFFIGLIGEYVGRIFNNTRGSPLVIVSDRIEHDSAAVGVCEENRTGSVQ